jgi:hypothetical protein
MIIIVQTTVNCYSKMTLNLYTLLVFKFCLKKAEVTMIIDILQS